MAFFYEALFWARFSPDTISPPTLFCVVHSFFWFAILLSFFLFTSLFCYGVLLRGTDTALA